MENNMTKNETERKIKFVIFWERTANSGIFETMASSHEEAVKKLGYSAIYVKMTCYQINGEKYEVGKVG